MYYKLGTIAGVVGILIIIGLTYWFYTAKKYPERVERIKMQHPGLPVKSQLTEHSGHRQKESQKVKPKNLGPEKHDRTYDKSGDMGYGGENKYDTLGQMFPGESQNHPVGNFSQSPQRNQNAPSSQGGFYSPSTNQNQPLESQNRQVNPNYKSSGQNRNWPSRQPNGQANSSMQNSPYTNRNRMTQPGSNRDMSAQFPGQAGQNQSRGQPGQSNRYISAQFPGQAGQNPSRDQPGQSNRDMSAQFPGQAGQNPSRGQPGQSNRDISAKFPGRTRRKPKNKQGDKNKKEDRIPGRRFMDRTGGKPKNKNQNDQTRTQNNSKQNMNYQNTGVGGNPQWNSPKNGQEAMFDIPGFFGSS